ncbi:MAG: TetR/AcrR family transcriptional regulator [Rhodococcus sp. (in: high G+C Gram-positive bacteria)]|nr:TetR/AcrR family transcriptional regulator [Rhodococcus sp. (in: high G+C Gram-positive bacteria)]
MTTHHSEVGRTYRGADPQQRQQDRRIRLLDAAVEVFGTTGYRTATVEKVCSEAGLTKRYFYESFTNSEDLLMATYARATESMRENILAGAAAEAESTEVILRSALTGFFTFVAENPKSARIAFVEILGVSPTVDALYRKTTNVVLHDGAAGGRDRRIQPRAGRAQPSNIGHGPGGRGPHHRPTVAALPRTRTSGLGDRQRPHHPGRGGVRARGRLIRSDNQVKPCSAAAPPAPPPWPAHRT